MKYIGIVSQCEVTYRYSNTNRFTAYYSHSTWRHGKEVKWFEIIENDVPKPVIVTKNNIKAYHTFFTTQFFI